ncbi:EPIDERMAL PATTERNING FACTOR-like protein 1 [Andrographis paniculata]|uniref:EPIDERMAL PATTERNING FACTOR-like protein 1 n=1 Tax=Andrographis paniculata TaxID=175694 RepID=UPI0021E82F1F|nr:EPIDERMAL PATTERNING FACTOR-like protein 1 [Andrographis paniculata]
MAMSCVTSLIPSSVAIVIVALFSLLSSAHCFDANQPANIFRGLVTADKSRLGSMPPTCHNKCNQCHPCTAVQVPSMPNSAAGRGKKKLDFFDSNRGSRYANYKPLGWKCACGSHFYNP